VPNRVSWLALGIGAYLAFTIALFPASTAYRWFAPPELRLAAISGTVWSGGAALGSIPGLPLRDVRWDLDAWPLVLGRLTGDFEARLADGFVSGRVSASASRVRFADLQASTSLPTLRELLPLNDTRGLVSISLEELELRDAWPVNALGNLRLGQLEVAPLLPTAGAGLIPLGNYEVLFLDSDGQGIRAQLQDTGGPLDASGMLTLSLDRSYSLEGLVRARPDAPSELAQGLAIMTGEPDAEGRRPFALTGSL